MTLPEAASSTGVAVAAFVVEVPAGQRRRVEREPVLEAGIAGEREDVAVAIECVVVDAAGFGFSPTTSRMPPLTKRPGAS